VSATNLRTVEPRAASNSADAKSDSPATYLGAMALYRLVGAVVAGRDLLENALAGEASAFALLLDPLWDPAYRLAFSMLGSPEAAEDAVQEAALKAWRGVRRLRPDTPGLRAWFLTIVANQCKSVRRGRWWRVVRLPNLPARTPDVGASAEQHLDLESALLKLSDEQRLVLALHYYLDLPIDEVAATLGISGSAAKSRISRAVRALRPALKTTEASR
jgi:RNA polymerase sigma factor (sigma-70 family)